MAADKLLSPGIRVIAKASSENVTASTALQDDDDLFFDAPSGANYYIEGVLHAVGGDDAADDETLKYNLAVPAGTVYSIQSGSALSGTVAVANLTATAINGITENGDIVTFVALVKVGTTGGAVKLQWAQNASTAEGVSLVAGSHLKVYPLNPRAAL